MKLLSSVYDCLTEALRRHIRFHENLDSELLLLSTPRQTKTAKKQGYLIPTSKENKNYPAWYKLTPKGKKILQSWKQKGYTKLKILGNWETITNEKGELPPKEMGLYHKKEARNVR